MKSKLVLWGSNAQDEKVMIAVALRADENKVDIWTFPESIATEDFYQQMMKEWRDAGEMEFPEPHTHQERELAMSESLLPDDLKVERTDVVQRAQTEWHFLVLSSKLHQSYKDRLSELRSRVDELENYDQGAWEGLKEFWNKVQEQVRERNLLREHADTLRDNTNALFSKMKELRSRMDEEFERLSKDAHDTFMEALDEVEKKVNEGARLPVMFDELKKLQRKFKDTKLTRDHRRKIWDKLDATFKEVKKRRFGDHAVAEGNSPLQRIQRRYEGLITAIGKMEASINRDRNDLNFQNHKIATTDGQLEAQIRQAKIKMIEERIRSKQEKLKEMNVTKEQLEKRIETEKQKEARREAEKAAKAKIAQEIKSSATARETETGKLEKAADAISAGKKDDSVAEAVSATLGESLEDVVDTVKAVAAVIGERIENAFEDLKEDVAEVAAEIKKEMKEKEVVAEKEEAVADTETVASEEPEAAVAESEPEPETKAEEVSEPESESPEVVKAEEAVADAGDQEELVEEAVAESETEKKSEE